MNKLLLVFVFLFSVVTTDYTNTLPCTLSCDYSTDHVFTYIPCYVNTTASVTETRKFYINSKCLYNQHYPLMSKCILTDTHDKFICNSVQVTIYQDIFKTYVGLVVTFIILSCLVCTCACAIKHTKKNPHQLYTPHHRKHHIQAPSEYITPIPTYTPEYYYYNNQANSQQNQQTQQNVNSQQNQQNANCQHNPMPNNMPYYPYIPSTNPAYNA